MLSNVHNASIYDSKFTMNQQIYHNYAPNRGLDSLKAAVAISAFHNSEERFDPPKCHGHTREAVLARIMRWARREIEPDKTIMWVYGAAGTGKSAIEQTIAELFDAEDGDIFVCSFFLSRADGSRNHSKAFVPTIAYQMTVAIPSLRPLIDLALERDPLLLNKSLKVQMTRLIIQPFQRFLAESDSDVGRYFVIVDGLDECMDGSRIQVIEEIQRLVTVFGQGSRFIASFASRPEPDIKNTFLHTSVSEILTRVALDDDYRADDDIRLFLSDKFALIQRTRPLIPMTWPTQDQLQTLVRKASGQFIYASTVYGFVSSPHHNPMKRLDIVLGVAPTNGSTPFAQLDALYRQILLSAPPDCVDEGIRVVASVLAMCTLNFNAFVPVGSRIMDLQEIDFRTHLDNYASIVYVTGIYARPLHASLADFLFDPERSLDLYRDPRTEHGYIFERLVRNLVSPSWDSELLEGSFAPFLRYTFHSGMNHLPLANKTPSVLEHLRLLFKSSFLENITNSPVQGVWTLSHRVFVALQWVFQPIKSLILPGLKDPDIDKEYLNAVHQLISTFLKKENPENIRLLKLVVTTRLLPRLQLSYYSLQYGFQTLFYPAKVLDVLSHDPFVSDYFTSPLVPDTGKFLQPSDCLALATHFLRYLHHNIFPRTKRLTTLGHRTHLNTLQFQAKYWSVTSQRFAAVHTLWPKYPFVKLYSNVDSDFPKDVAVSVVTGAYIALHYLPFVLSHTPPTSYRLLQLCQRPNIARFPWCVSPNLARAAAKAMKKYRNQFIPNRVKRRDTVQSLDLLSEPKNEIVENLADRIHQLEVSVVDSR